MFLLIWKFTNSQALYTYSKITNNTFIGLSISETDLFLYYPDTDYDEKIQLDSLRLRYGYLF